MHRPPMQYAVLVNRPSLYPRCVNFGVRVCMRARMCMTQSCAVAVKTTTKRHSTVLDVGG